MEMRGDQFDVWSAGVEITFKAKQPKLRPCQSHFTLLICLQTTTCINKQLITIDKLSLQTSIQP